MSHWNQFLTADLRISLEKGSIWELFILERKKPYGVRVEFEIDGEYFLDKKETLPSFIGIWDEACILLSETHIFHLERDKASSKHEGKNIWNTYIEGFETASEAERAGKWFATALMFNSVNYSYPPDQLHLSGDE